jgi:hypothetical protein
MLYCPRRERTNMGELALGTCGFCSKKFELPGKYVYPVPGMGEKQDNRVGKIACPDCYPALHQKQLDEGLILPALPSHINLHAWKETP